jgi:hypothetical protein
MQNLFIESEKHRIRIEKLVNLMTEKNYDPNKVEHFFPALIGVEVSSEEGEIWKIKDIKSYSVTLYGRYTKPYEVIDHKVSF